MRALKVACFLVVVQAGASAQRLLEQPVSLQVKNVPVEGALQKLTKENDVRLAYSEQFFSKKKTVTVRARRKPVGEVLEAVLEGTGVGMKEVGGQIVLYLLPEGQIQFTR